MLLLEFFILQLLQQDPGKYTKMPCPKMPKICEFYPNDFGQILSDFRSWPQQKPIFIRTPDQASPGAKKPFLCPNCSLGHILGGPEYFFACTRLRRCTIRYMTSTAVLTSIRNKRNYYYDLGMLSSLTSELRPFLRFLNAG